MAMGKTLFISQVTSRNKKCIEKIYFSQMRQRISNIFIQYTYFTILPIKL